MKILVISRHSSAREFTREEVEKYYLGDVQIVEDTHLDTSAYIDADIVAGVLPVSTIEALQRQGKMVLLLSLPQIREADRGRELSPSEMREAGARLDKVHVQTSPPPRTIFLPPGCWGKYTVGVSDTPYPHNDKIVGIDKERATDFIKTLGFDEIIDHPSQEEMGEMMEEEVEFWAPIASKEGCSASYIAVLWKRDNEDEIRCPKCGKLLTSEEAILISLGGTCECGYKTSQ